MKLDSRAVFLVLTGAVQTAWAPSFITALKVRLPGARLSVAMTPGALRFLTVDTVRALGVDDIIVDDWEMWSTQKHHVDLAQSADAFIIYPASMSFIAKLAAGSAPGPVLLALQCTGAPIVVCPSVPEGAYENEIIRSNLRRLTDRENLTVMPPHRGQSAWTGREFVGAVADIGEAIACVEAVWAMASGEQNELRSI